jgi:Kef-type K+ transport system membrane component KefB
MNAARRARRIARLLFGGALLIDAAIVLALVASWRRDPDGSGAAPPYLLTGITVVAAAALLIGQLWMVRILRSVEDPEGHRSFFRAAVR